MKNFIILLVVLFSLIIMTNETKAVCPPGFAQRIVPIPINGCLYDVEICAKCIVPAPPRIIYVNAFTKVDPNCYQSWSTDAVIQAIYNTVFNVDFIRTYICTNPPPCDVPPFGILYTYNEFTCFQKIRIGTNSIRYEACRLGSDTCRSVWRVCWRSDGTAQPSLISGPTLISGGYNCPLGDEAPDPIEIGFPSDCFGLATTCDE